MSESTKHHDRDKPRDASRRDVMGEVVRGAAMLGIGGVVGSVAARTAGQTDHTQADATPRSDHRRWQIDPYKCVACGLCAIECVLDESAVKCVHSYEVCGYCELCTGYFVPQPAALDTGAENQLCPTAAIIRKFIEDPYFEYHIDEALCIGCGRCVKGCNAFGNGSLYLQIRHDRCINCNECAIARVCPSEAISLVPADSPYRLKSRNEGGHA